MKINSVTRVNPDSQTPNFFSSTFQPTNSQTNNSQNQPRPKQSPNLQIFNDQTSQQQPPPQFSHPQSTQPGINVSPNRTRQAFDRDTNTSLASFDRNQLPKRPMSQVPTYNRAPINPNDTQFRPSQQFQPQIPPNFQNNASSLSQAGPQGFPIGLSRDALRDNISKRNQLANELTLNKNFFRENLERKNNEFKETIRSDLKKNIYDKVLKTSLHYIYKHYENLKTSVNRDETLRILNTNLAKQQTEISEARRQSAQLEAANKAMEERLQSQVNQPGLIKAQPTIVENITKEDIEKKVNELNRENQEIEKALFELKRKKDAQLYDLKMKHENKGRVLMEQRAIKLALQYADSQDPEQMMLKSRIEELIRRIELNDATRKCNQNYILSEQKEKLEKELDLLRFYSTWF